MADEPAPEKAAPKEPETPPEPEPTPETKGEAHQDGDLPPAVKEILSKERKAARDAEKARKAAEAKIKEFEDRDKTETEKLAERASAAEKNRDEALAKLSRYEVAAEKKLPGDLVDFLTGSKEEMEAQADTLLARMKNGEPSPDFDGGAREPTPEAKSPQEAHNDFLLNVLGRSPTQTQ